MHYYSKKSLNDSPVEILQQLPTPSVELINDVSKCLCFTGHRKLTESEKVSVSLQLDHVLAALYNEGYNTFISGGALGFDTLAAEAVIRLRDYNHDVNLIMAIPCATQSSKWNDRDKSIYKSLLENANEVVILSNHYFSGCMQVRNRFMVDHSSFVVSYMKHLQGGTYSTISYALKRNKPYLNIALQGVCLDFLSSRVFE